MIDRIAIALIAAAALFVAWVVPAPFLLATMAGSAWLLWRAKATGRRELAICATALPVFVLLRVPLLAAVTHLTPHTVDWALAPLDFGMGVRLRAWLAWHPWAYQGLKVVYLDGLPLWLAVALAEADDSIRLIRRYILAALLAVPFYLLCPATGPAWVGVADAPRNAMPSLHLTWALLAWWAVPGKYRWLGGIGVALTALACVGLGEHYIVDLVAAVPFGWVVVMVEGFVRGLNKSREDYGALRI